MIEARRFTSRLALSLILLAPLAAQAAAASTGAEGSEEEDTARVQKTRTLEERIRPVSGNLFAPGKRHELEAGVDLSLSDPFFQKYLFGLKYAYHFNDAFSVGLRGSFGVSTASGNVNLCTADGCRSPTKDELLKTPGNVSLITGLDVAWAPLYGKVNVLAEKVLHFDTFAVGGLDGIQYANPAASGASAFAFGGHLGVGQHYVLNSFTALRVDLRDYLYQGQRDVNGAQGKLENQLMLELGLSFFFPLHPNPDAS